MDGRGERDSGPFEIQRDNRAGQVRVSGCPTNFQHFTIERKPRSVSVLCLRAEVRN